MVDEGKKMHIEYHARHLQVLDWQGIVAMSLMVGGFGGHVALGLWAIFTRADLFFMWPLIGTLAMGIVGTVWWFLNKRGLS